MNEVNVVSESGRIPLWIVATVAGLGVLTVVGLFFYGAYAGLGSSL
jgi:photosystem II PsbJ protein